jgi:ABC-type multidrug transport system permease subunit
MPLTYLGDAMRQLMVGGAPVHSMALNLGVLTAFLVIFFSLAVRLFKYE